MNKLYTVAALIGVSFCLISFSTNPPDGNTGAPGDQFCSQCHFPSNPNLNGTLTVLGFPDVITPLETYRLTIENRVTQGTAVRGGFQMTVLTPINTKAGDFSNPSEHSAVSVFGGRQYWDHDPAQDYPDSNVVKWSVDWTAPDLPSGSVIRYFAAGNVANGNFQSTGDHPISTTGSGVIVIAANEELSETNLITYPNPGSDFINIKDKDGVGLNGSVQFFNTSGQEQAIADMKDGVLKVPDLAPGLYLLKLHQGPEASIVRWIKQ